MTEQEFCQMTMKNGCLHILKLIDEIKVYELVIQKLLKKCGGDINKPSWRNDLGQL